MSPIFVRPVREQLEHDRLIRHLQGKYKRKFEPLINVGDERVAPVKIGTNMFFPDLVLMEGKRLAGLVEVETGESVNNLEAMAQWVHFSRARVPFHLYVPVQAYDAARRLSEANAARVSEIWTYRPAAEGFDLVRMFHDTASPAVTTRLPAKPAPAAKPAAAAPKPAPVAKNGKAKKPAAAKPAKAAAKNAARPARKPAKKAAPARKASKSGKK